MDLSAEYGLIGKRALVCGSTQGIGRACAIRLARLGAEVTLVARDEAALIGVEAELCTEHRQKHSHICADFTDPDDLASKVAEHVGDRGEIQILLNNTGGPAHGPIVEAKPTDFLTAINMHVVCNQLLVQTLLPGMKASGYGRIINIISISVKEPIAGLGVSNTTRWAVASWAKTMAGELGPFGITVNNVLPGYTATARLDSLIRAKAGASGVSEDTIREAMISQVPLGRLAEADEIAAAVAFLASPLAGYVTGINVPVDGGRTASL